MKYEKPELSLLASALNSIQVSPKCGGSHKEQPNVSETVAAYEDWE